MKQALSDILILLSEIARTGCASLSKPERPAYSGADNVSSAQPDQLFGIWQVTELNPIGDSPPQTTVIEYRDDGSVIGNTILEGEEFAAIGPLEFVLEGRWTLNADTLTHEDIKMSSKNDTGIGSIFSNVINNQKGISGQANIYELSADRIVMLGTDGAAMEYIRQ